MHSILHWADALSFDRGGAGSARCERVRVQRERPFDEGFEELFVRIFTGLDFASREILSCQVVLLPSQYFLSR